MRLSVASPASPSFAAVGVFSHRRLPSKSASPPMRPASRQCIGATALSWRVPTAGSNRVPRQSATPRHRTFASRPENTSIPGRWLSATLALAAAAGLSTIAYLSRESRPSTLNPDSFSPFLLESRDEVSSTSAILKLRPLATDSKASNWNDLWRKAIWSVQIKQPQLQIARSYTPLPPMSGPGPGADGASLRVLVRREISGEMSNYLHRLSPGTTIELRGPTVEYELPKDVGEVLFIAGGTGIAPALQTVAALSPSTQDYKAAKSPKLRILWANRRREECTGMGYEASERSSWWPIRWPQHLWKDASPKIGSVKSDIVRQLEHLQSELGERLEVRCFVDEEGQFITSKTLDSWMRAADETNGLKRLILISGPDGFVAHLAGPKVWRNGKEVQGPLGGVLQTLGARGWEVRKL